MPIRFLTGQRLTADLLNANVYDFLPVTYTKPALTSRASTVTLADDPDLAGIPLTVGSWEIDLTIFYTTTVSNVPGLRTQWGFTGTWASANRLCFGPGSGQIGDSGAITDATMKAFVTDTQDAVYRSGTSSAYTGVREHVRQLTVTGAGNLSLKWAQQTSNAGATIVQPSSGFTIRKIT